MKLHSPQTLTTMSSSDSDHQLPLKKIPGNYGLPFIGPLRDRYDYFYNQGRDEFFNSRIKKHQSTVFRTNMPPGPFMASNPRVVCVLDAVSFPVLFDTDKVEKKDLFTGTYMTSTSYTGGYRVLSYLDPSEPNHKALKTYLFSLLASWHDGFIPLFRKSCSELFVNLEAQVESTGGKADFNAIEEDASFKFVFRLFCDDKSPSDSVLGSEGPTSAAKWLVPQLAPILTLGLPKIFDPLEDLFLHTFPIPYFLIKSSYKKIYDAFFAGATSALAAAAAFGLTKEEACHNLVFFSAFNTYGGLKVMFPSLIKWVAAAGESLHQQLRDEIRAVVKTEGGVTFSAIEQMELTKSVVYETLRMDPPVQFQYGKAKADTVVSSHDARFEIKKGEIIFGYQPLATRDQRVMERADEFVGSRFVGPEGEKLLKYVYWSNGRETEDPTVENKQCPGKDLVVLLARVFLVDLFLRYDTFQVETKDLPIGYSVTWKSMVKAKSS